VDGATLFLREYDGAQQPRSGAERATIAPYGPFPAADGTVLFGIQNEREWAIFCSDVPRHPELAKDTRFTGNALRVENRPALHEEINDALSSLAAE
jgi:itaconate CoA-transferase